MYHSEKYISEKIDTSKFDKKAQDFIYKYWQKPLVKIIDPIIKTSTEYMIEKPFNYFIKRNTQKRQSEKIKLPPTTHQIDLDDNEFLNIFKKIKLVKNIIYKELNKHPNAEFIILKNKSHHELIGLDEFDSYNQDKLNHLSTQLGDVDKNTDKFLEYNKDFGYEDIALKLYPIYETIIKILAKTMNGKIVEDKQSESYHKSVYVYKDNLLFMNFKICYDHHYEANLWLDIFCKNSKYLENKYYKLVENWRN